MNIINEMLFDYLEKFMFLHVLQDFLKILELFNYLNLDWKFLNNSIEVGNFYSIIEIKN